jgi:hypothetical protein
MLQEEDCLTTALTEESAKQFHDNALLWVAKTTNQTLLVRTNHLKPVTKPYINVYQFPKKGRNETTLTETIRNGGGFLECRPCVNFTSIL